MGRVTFGPNHPDYGFVPEDAPAPRQPRKAERSSRTKVTARAARQTTEDLTGVPLAADNVQDPDGLVPCAVCLTLRSVGAWCRVCIPRRWARDFDQCQNCKRADSAHAGHGICRRCAAVLRSRAGYRPPSYNAQKTARPVSPDGVVRCRRCNEPVTPGQHCASCRTRAKNHKTQAAITEIHAAGNLGRRAAG